MPPCTISFVHLAHTKRVALYLDEYDIEIENKSLFWEQYNNFNMNSSKVDQLAFIDDIAQSVGQFFEDTADFVKAPMRWINPFIDNW